MQRNKQSKQIDLQRGLFLVRYTAADDEARPPKVRIAVNPKYKKNIELVLTPDDQEPVLWQPGSCLVVRALGVAQLLVEVIPTEAGGSTAATVKIETLTQGAAVEAAAADETEDSGVSDRLSILGHVAGFGDVIVRANEWIAGPDAPARIEGLAIDWPGKPDDVDLRYSVKLARPHAASGRTTSLGDYAGTRGRALPIVAVSLELTGPGASGFQMFGDATFLGAPLMRVTGRRLAIAGPTGREPLVGFRLRLGEAGASLQPESPTVARTHTTGQVRVFRPQSAGSRSAPRAAFPPLNDEQPPA